jgi:hypothetical protein
MAVNFAYNYAYIDPETNMCIEILTTSDPNHDEQVPNSIPIPVYDEEYLFKYYIDGNWYEDPEATIPWTSSLL